MKKLLLGIAICTFVVMLNQGTASAVYYTTPTAGNMNFYPMMQRQLEKEETLDFINNPEDYQQRREEKDAKLDFMEGKTDVNPYFKPTSFNLGGHTTDELPPQKPMEFTKDENGQIKIQSIR